MMKPIKNKVQLIGQLEDAPRFTNLEGDRKTAVFTVITSESFRNKLGEKVTEVQHHKVVCWGKLAEIAEKYLLKGIEVVIEGKLVNGSFTDMHGEIHYCSEIHAYELLILTKKG